MSLPKVAVVILNWNGKKFLEQFLPSVEKSNYENLEIILADNASTDDSVAYTKQHYSNIRIISLTKNEGFAGGYNAALKQVDADYYVLLNQDVEVTQDWINPIISFMEKDKSVAACQPKIKSFYQKTHFEYAGAAGGWMDPYGYTFCRGRIFDTIEEDKGQYDDICEVFWASGACLFIRSALFHQFGGFDKYLFAHMEEIDLCWRMKNEGYKIVYHHQSVVYHVGGGSLPQGNPRKTYLNFRNNLIIMLKNMPTKKLWYIIPFRLALDGLAGIRSLLKGNLKDVGAILKAHFHFYFQIPATLKKRKRIRTKANNTGIYCGSIIWHYFFLKEKLFSKIGHCKVVSF